MGARYRAGPMRHGKGFTLIEMMVAVAIVGILASVAMPQYSVYVARARVATCIALVGPAKVAIVEFFSLQSRFPADSAEAGYSPASTDLCNSVDIVGNTIIVSVDVPGAPASSIVFGFDADRQAWACGTPNQSIWAFVPGACRNPII